MTPYLEKAALFPPQIKKKPLNNLETIVVIPAYNELNLVASLASISACTPPRKAVEVIVVINGSERSAAHIQAQNKQAYEEALVFASSHSRQGLSFHILYHPTLPKKHAGVGLARKIGMDEAVYRFSQIDKQTGTIVCYDADSNCDQNYLVEIEQFFETHPKMKACSIHFEHPLEGEDYSADVFDAIIDYELHLRYYVHAQRYAGFPFAHQTIGSSMAVRCDAYQQQGGMNKRKAGEDFYFLQKFIPLGHFGELTSTRVIPSPRVSDRVPFGTGKAVGDILNDRTELTTYAPASFKDLKCFLEIVNDLFLADNQTVIDLIYSLPASMQAFLETIDWSTNLKEIKSNTTNLKTFRQRFYRWFNAFTLMKCVHFLRDEYYPNITVGEAAQWLLKQKDLKSKDQTNKQLLETYRIMDKTVSTN